MIDQNADEADRLKQVKELFEDALTHDEHHLAEAHKAGRYYYNTRLVGQWDADDLAYMQEDGRGTFTFNISKDKVDSFLGIYRDSERRPKIRPAAGASRVLAEALETITDKVSKEAGIPEIEVEVLKAGSINGVGTIAIEVRPDDRNPAFINISAHRLTFSEVNWDPGSITANKSDARYLFWHRYMTKSEFMQEYPDLASEYDELAKKVDPHVRGDVENNMFGEFSLDGDESGRRDYDNGSNHFYFDRNSKKIRIIQMQYIVAEKQRFAFNPETGMSEAISDDDYDYLSMLIEEGDEEFAGIEFQEMYVDKYKTIEFIGNKILDEWDGTGPHDGFSLVSFCFTMDEEECVPFGLLRNIFDPQQEVNKSFNLSLEYMAQATAPGVIAEKGAVTDEDSFERANKTPGATAFVEDGAISGNRIMIKTPPPVGGAVETRLERALDIIDRISGIPSQGIHKPAAEQEAAATVAMRMSKSRQVTLDPIRNYENFQKKIKKLLVEIVINAMPDAQIIAYLADEKKYKIQQGYIVQVEVDEQGKETFVDQAPIRNINSVCYNIDLEHTSDNATLRMVEFEKFLMMHEKGIPVDPGIIVELASSNKHTQDRLLEYIKTFQSQTAKAKAEESKQFADQIMATLRTEATKAEETRRHNIASEQIDIMKAKDRKKIDLLKILEQADEHEKDLILQQIMKDKEATKNV